MKAKIRRVTLLSLLMGSLDADARQVTHEGFCKGASLALPPGEVLAEDGVQHISGAGVDRTVVPLFDEAYVIVQLRDSRRWYATWLPYVRQWETQRIDSPWFRSGTEDAALAL